MSLPNGSRPMWGWWEVSRQIHGGCCRPGPDPSPPPPPLWTPKQLHGTIGFVGAPSSGDFALVLRHGVNFCSQHMCFYAKCSDFFWVFQICQRHVKQFSTHLLPTSDFIPHIDCSGPSTSGYIGGALSAMQLFGRLAVLETHIL